ncbi:hypothetical protein [Paenibacillus abyssi]|uniref:Uncharacterized protein n=1 Tax=Paenibacillus abyssi TaxID=1340531 RepID=A0A917FRQ1_9BACL|nr:hypothetical protein [Paenibacillus abyssi]GGF98246.1 hypothetical protein GCM10010916_14370 [Paenibacillus abyssi]
MNHHQLRALTITKRVTSVFFILGLGLFLFSFFVSDPNSDYFLNIGIGVMFSAALLFACGTFFALVDRSSEKRNGYSEDTI